MVYYMQVVNKCKLALSKKLHLLEKLWNVLVQEISLLHVNGINAVVYSQVKQASLLSFSVTLFIALSSKLWM